jgi:large conductance mechanosensitive channel
MRKMLGEFREFINRGDVVTIAVGLVMALYVQKIVDAVLNGVINPIISAIFGESNYQDIGFDIGDARISIGLVIDAIISFLAVAFFLFWVVKAYNAMKERAARQKGPESPEAPAPELAVLTEIRDELRAQRQA